MYLNDLPPQGEELARAPPASNEDSAALVSCALTAISTLREDVPPTAAPLR